MVSRIASIPLPVDIPDCLSTSSMVPDTATPTPASVTNDVSATPAASPARSGRTTAWVATVVNAYTSPSVKPHAVSAITYAIQPPRPRAPRVPRRRHAPNPHDEDGRILRRQPPRQRTAERGTDRRPEERQARHQRVEAAHLLQIHRRQEDRHGVRDIGDRCLPQPGRVNRGVATQRQVDQRPPHAVLDEDEYRPTPPSATDERNDRPPALRHPQLRCAVKCQREQADSDGDQRQTGDVDAAWNGLVALTRCTVKRQRSRAPPAQRHAEARRSTASRASVGQTGRRPAVLRRSPNPAMP